MLQQKTLLDLHPVCAQLGIANVCYWVLMKGLLTGKLERDHPFDPRDKRLSYPIYQGALWQRSQDFLDKLRGLASEIGCTVAQLVLAWTLRLPFVDIALCGAKRPAQIVETAAAMQLDLDTASCESIDAWISDLGNTFVEC